MAQLETSFLIHTFAGKKVKNRLPIFNFILPVMLGKDNGFSKEMGPCMTAEYRIVSNNRLARFKTCL